MSKLQPGVPDANGKAVAGNKGKEYWRGLDELADTPEFRRHLEREFPSALEQVRDPVSRRKFLGLMGAAVALSGVVGCSRPLAKILPYSKMPEDLLPGVPQIYATVYPFRGVGEGILVTSNEGRPTKIEGNPDHPSSHGATHVFAQASILELYDPDRSKHPRQDGARRSWDEFAAWAGSQVSRFQAVGGEGLRFLAEASASPATREMRDAVARAFPQAKWHTYEPLNRDNVIEGSRLAYGRPLRTQLQLDQADVILSLDSDFMISEPNSVRHARDFARRRRVTSEKDSLNRLYVVESQFSVTGAMADHRLRLAHGQVVEFVRELAKSLADEGVALFGAAQGGSGSLGNKKWIDAVAKDLNQNRGRCVILAGSSQPPEVHAFVHVANQVLGAVGPAVRYTQEPYPANQTASIRELAESMGRGEVDTLFVLGGNPVYDAPADLDFAGGLGNVANTVHLSSFEDETSVACSWHLPLAHYLEAWGDAESWNGTVSIQQPLIAPLYESKSELEVLAGLLGNAIEDGHEILRDKYGRLWGSFSLDTKWNRALHDGLIPGTAYAEVAVSINATPIRRAWQTRTDAPAPDRNALEIVFRPDNSTWDGRFANNGWLQELPDNMSKLVWDNAALMSRRTAEELGVAEEDRINVRLGDREIVLPACITPGLPDFSISVPLGYGRTRAGRVGDGVGFNSYALRGTEAMYEGRGASVSKAGGRHRLVSTQGHHAMDGRPLVREASLEEYRKEPDFVDHAVEVPELVTLYTNREYDYKEGHQWGMSIDLNTCIGCNACAIACQSENNIAIVGKDEVDRGREMHWIRIDRYYTGKHEDPEAVQQPVPCMQCENAPCESVCPVNATSHSSEGLNQMTYNRCIGTRYCNNNCPYKVRRFNYYAWRKDMTEVEKMGMNPDVTVRMRGVMEKCTYCVQRSNRAKIGAKNEGRAVRDGEIRTACQQVCPTESIVFGDVNDPQSRVSRLKEQNRDYAMLEELNVRPRTTYLARIRNRNPELEHTA
jgi:molybdopterin-containing oxidoreductase family iron-sulfur binding subunit